MFGLSFMEKAQKLSHKLGNNTIRILPNISRSEGNQNMKFHQLIEYSVKNFFI